MKLFLDAIVPAVWTLLWIGGGWLLAASLFRLRRGETAMVGVGLGLVLQVWLANALAHVLTALMAFWLSSALLALGGIVAAVQFRAPLRFRLSVTQWATLLALTALFISIGRGLGIFDDYQNLPTVSLMAAGDVPPHFALNPSLRFGYHYALLLFAAEIMRLGSLFPWSALDVARGFSLALPLVLAGLWAYRLTGSRWAAPMTGCLVAFAGGSRWLLLLLPPGWLDRVSASVTLIGSAAASATTLSEAMVSNWKIDGAGPLPFPFGFYSGVNQPYVMAYTGIAGSGILIMLLILMTAARWRHWSAAIVQAILLGSLAIANEISFLLIGMGFLIAAAAWMVHGRVWRIPKQLGAWLVVMGAAVVIATLQGGMLTEIAGAIMKPQASTATYFDTTPILVWPPAIVSAHLGALSFANPWQLAGGLLEIGPVVLVTPLILAWGWKSLRSEKWFEAALVYSSFGAVIAVFVQFRGPLFSATPRLMGGWFFVCALYAVPLLWAWLKKRGDMWKAGAVLAAVICSFGGLVLLGIQLAAIQRPVLATFISTLDARMSQEYWNRLDAGEEVFDPVVFRAPTVFGRFTNSSPSWYTRFADWQALRDAPDPFKIRAAGFAYAYLDSDYWESMSPGRQAGFDAACVHQIAQVDGIHSEKDYTKDFRRLVDVRDCK
jgi:hypothetical protein